jgi:HD-like signal output (HDOD) protein
LNDNSLHLSHKRLKIAAEQPALNPDNTAQTPIRADLAREATLSKGAKGLFDIVEASHLLDQLREGQYDLRRIGLFFAAHPSLQAEVIKRSNSVVFYRSQATTDIPNAILRLGIYELYDIISKALAKHRREEKGTT